MNLVVLLICVTPICFAQTNSDCLPPDIISCDPRDKFRSFDGTCNNLGNPTAGSKYASLIRMITPERDAGEEPQRETVDGESLKSPQEISNILSRADVSVPYDSTLTEMVLEWGQFITNDITVVPETATPQDCNGVSAYLDGSNVYGEDMNILLDAKKADRPHYFNGLSAYIDASNVYGENNLLDTDKTDPKKVKIDKKRPLGVPSQANQMEETDTPGASGLTSLFEREHERVEQGLKKVNKKWRRERYYNTTRAIVGAILQKITIEEYLPTLIGPLPEYKPKNHSYAGIYNAFASAAYSIGHTPPTNSQPMVDTKSKSSLSDALSQKLSSTVSMADTALYIQRDRSNHLPSYNDFRQACGLEAYIDFDNIHDHSENNRGLLMEAYGNVDDIELLPGGITETRLPNSLFGPVFKCIMERQFQLLRDGDRFWYQRSDPVTGFSSEQLEEIRKMTLAKIVCKNDGIREIQPDVFRVVDNRDNQLTRCGDIPDMNLSVFQEDEN